MGDDLIEVFEEDHIDIVALFPSDFDSNNCLIFSARLCLHLSDLLILFFKNQTSVFDLCISVEIKVDSRPPEPDLS
nr:hypothetical protein CFP56_39105 [Quercus suber]